MPSETSNSSISLYIVGLAALIVGGLGGGL